MTDDRVKNAVLENVKTAMEKECPIVYEDITYGWACPRSTFYKILKDNNINISDYNKNIKKVHADKLKDEISMFTTAPAKPETSSDIVEFDYVTTDSPFITASLISNRHKIIDSSTGLYIFPGPIKADIIHNYNKLYEIAYKWIKENLTNQGITKLKVFVTGLTQCVVAVIKACITLDITLILLHYDNSCGKYQEQLVTGKDDQISSSLLDLYATVKKQYKIKLLKHDRDYFEKCKHFYIIKVEPLGSSSEDTLLYVTDDMQLMFIKAGEECKRIQSLDYAYRVIADEIGFGSTEKEFKFLNSFISYYNKEKE